MKRNPSQAEKIGLRFLTRRKRQRNVGRLACHIAGKPQPHRRPGLTRLGSNKSLLANEIWAEIICDDLEICLWHRKGAWSSHARGSGLCIETHQVERGIRRTLELDNASIGCDTIHGRIIFSKCDIAFESRLHPDHRPEKEGDDSIMSDDKPDVPLLPWPAGEGDCKEVDTEKSEPKLKPRGLVDVGLGDLRIKVRLGEGRNGASYRKSCQKNKRELQGSEDMNYTPNSRTFSACSDHLLASGGRCNSCAHGRLNRRTTACIPRQSYFVDGAFQLLAMPIL